MTADGEGKVTDVQEYIEYYWLMLRIRRCEERIGWLFARGLTTGTAHLSIGQEASAVGVLAAARRRDQVVSTHRGHSHVIAKGSSTAGILAEICRPARTARRSTPHRHHQWMFEEFIASTLA